MGSGFKNRNRIVVATAAEPGKSNPEIGPAGGGTGTGAGDGVGVDDGAGASSETPHAANVNNPIKAVAANRNRRRVTGVHWLCVFSSSWSEGLVRICVSFSCGYAT